MNGAKLNNEKLEEILTTFTYETLTLDYKASCPWETGSFLKDIIAMANNSDVSYIIVGMKEDTEDVLRYQREGIADASVLASYEVDKMKDQVHGCVDQAIDFEVFKLQDLAGLQYVAIRIIPSKSPPVFCTKGEGEAKTGVIYIRSGLGRVQSRPIQHFTEMQRFIRLAGSAFLTNLYQDGLTCPHLFANVEAASEKDLDKYKQQRGDL